MLGPGPRLCEAGVFSQAIFVASLIVADGPDISSPWPPNCGVDLKLALQFVALKMSPQSCTVRVSLLMKYDPIRVSAALSGQLSSMSPGGFMEGVLQAG